MKREQIDQAVLDSQRMMEAYWQGDPAYCIARLDDAFDWTGSGEHEHTHGSRDMWAEMLRRYAKSHPRVDLTEQVYYPVATYQDGCAVFGTYIGQTRPESGYLLRERQRVTFTWKLRGSRLLLTSLHLSNPMETVRPGESFPFAISKSSWDYVRHQITLGARRDAKEFAMKAVGGSLHVLALDDIAYMEARDRYTVVHSIEDVFTVRTCLSRMAEGLNGHFLRVGRSYCVNVLHVKAFEKNGMLLFSGDVIPVPARNVTAMRAAFLQKME